MIRKTTFFLLSGFILAGHALWSAEPVLVYPDEAALRQQRAVLGVMGNRGAVISSQDLPLVSTACLVGTFQGDLRQGSLLQYDAELGLMTIKLLESVKQDDLQKIFRQNVDQFLPLFSAGKPMETSAVKLSTPTTAELFSFKINNQPAGLDPIVLSQRKEESSCQFSIVYQSTVPIWNFSMTLSAAPKMSFWKKQRSQDLTDVPRPVFHYDHQAFFKSLTSGSTVDVPISLFFIKEESYQWTVTIKTKIGTLTKQIPIVFKNSSQK